MDEEEPAITNATVQERPVTLVDLTCDEDDSVNAPLSGEVVLNFKKYPNYIWLHYFRLCFFIIIGFTKQPMW